MKDNYQNYDPKPDEKLVEQMLGYENASLEDLKKNPTGFLADVEEILENKRTYLQESCLQEHAMNAQVWKARYLSNPVMQEIAGRLVWEYRGKGQKKLFTVSQLELNETKKRFCAKGNADTPHPISIAGYSLDLNEYGNVSLAHPIDMTSGEIRKWKEYLEQNEIEQPFPQIQDPVLDIANLEHRYEGAMIQKRALMALTEQGFQVSLFHKEPLLLYGSEFKLVFHPQQTKYFANMTEIPNEEWILFGALTSNLKPRYQNMVLRILDDAVLEGIFMGDQAERLSEMLPELDSDDISYYMDLAAKYRSINCRALLLDHQHKNSMGGKRRKRK